jgi:hypothetical protein
MEARDNKSRLRLVRIAGDSVLQEKILQREKLSKDLIDVITLQLTNIVEEMEVEWENNPGSEELREGFHLLAHYVRCLGRYGSGGKNGRENP